MAFFRDNGVLTELEIENDDFYCAKSRLNMAETDRDVTSNIDMDGQDGNEKRRGEDEGGKGRLDPADMMTVMCLLLLALAVLRMSW